jgi:hypothetical protein
MAAFVLRLFADRYAPGGCLALGADASRILHVADGFLSIASGDTLAALAADSTWQGAAPASLRAGTGGARVLRFELLVGDAPGVAGDGVESGSLKSAPVNFDRERAWLIRCDRVEFPPGGVAYTHTHQGPGIRCLERGRIRIETAGTSHDYAPGEAWFESGPDPVFAAGSATETTAFIRVMILPRDYLGRSSIRYLKPEDQDKPKRQSYRIAIDAAIELPGAPA